MKTNSDYKNEALAALKGNWGQAVLATAIVLLITLIVVLPSEMPTLNGMMDEDVLAGMVASNDVSGMMAYMSQISSWSSLGTLLQILVYNVLMVAMSIAFLKLLRGDGRVTSNLFESFTNGYWHKVWGMVLMNIFLILWTLLLIIPGIIKAFSYAMSPYILEENPELSANEAIDRSRAMMKGHKFDLFWLYLSFIGWAILCLFTAGIGYLWLAPYMQTAEAAFYEEVKADYEIHGGLD